ncbi:hypothetical protein [Gelidibacter japonicus]|uniref:hypothetical protein n=1 Tax=Gelidibacter japonicus TaxID=1962232 RepID=UPI003A8FFEF1
MNSDRLSDVLSLRNTNFIITPAVYDEVSKVPEQLIKLDKYIATGQILHYQGDLNVEVLDQLFETYDLGDGETEAVLLSQERGYQICCDDKRARGMAEYEVGESRVMGSLRLLKFVVAEEIIECTDAYSAYRIMIQKGGFLPNAIKNHFFCKPS